MRFLLTTLLLTPFLPPVSSAPTTTNIQTHCLCTLTTSSNPAFPSPYTDSLANPDTLIPTAFAPPDLCAAFGPSLEALRRADAGRYAALVGGEMDLGAGMKVKGTATATGEERPLATTVLLRMAAERGFADLGVVLPAVGTQHPHQQQEQEQQPQQEDSEPRVRIHCRPAPLRTSEAWALSWMSALVVRIAVAMLVLGCVAEAVLLGLRWLHKTPPTLHLTIPLPLPLPVSLPSAQNAPLRLYGAEQRLRAHPAHLLSQQDLRSPGVEKKMRAYQDIDDEDDEFNRPVM